MLLTLIVVFNLVLCATKSDVEETFYFEFVHLKGEYMISTKLRSRY
jgi:hypothetical protein